MRRSALMTKPAKVNPAKARPFKLKMVEPPEAAILSAILQALAYHPGVAFAHRMNSGAYLIDSLAGRRFIRYGFPGCPDIIGMTKQARAIYIEVKRPSGRVSPDQQRFLELARQHGAAAGVARSVDQALGIVDSANGR